MASDGNPRRTEYDSFWYFTLRPFSRQAVQIRDDSRVQLFSRKGDFDDGRPSGWHGESNRHMRHHNRYQVDMNCRGEESHLRKLVVLPDVAPHVWYAYHADTLWAVLVYAGRLTEHDVQSSLNSSRRDRGPLQQADPCPFAPFPRYDERAAPRSHSDMLNSSDRDRAFGRYDERAAPRSPFRVAT